ncbi:GGDEF domain-containing protein [Psychromonas ossibalaenae]|uniref:GGDEF domain-containing protein n=1 Tax=Psychromonas ossibalaenae TaxID=444922 RepID=UPI000382786F|nr:GGDEF domain-containing protein [Psychromonas ossibalaenae]
MESFCWDTYYITGLEEVDQQHFYMVKLINKFGDLLAQNELLMEDISRVFNELYDYTVYHFREEELMMRNAGIDPRFLSHHIETHQEFIYKLTTMNNEVSLDNPSSLRNLFEFLTQWLVYHILGMDQNMARQLEKIKSGCSAEIAYEAQDTAEDKATEALLKALSKLFQQVSDRNTELLQLNQTLELKVVQRTEALQAANKHLEQLAVTDVLTNLPNRRYAMSHLSTLWEKAKQEKQPLSCLMIDADHFKDVNDRYGHDSGDLVLTELSLKLQQTLRNDDTVCRLGGDEFLVICENTDFSGAEHIARLLHEAVAELQVVFVGGAWPGSVSIGVASRQPDMSEFEELIKLADQGVYLAKEAGKNCVRSVLS